MSGSTSTSRVLSLVFTDLADSTALKAERGDVVGGDLIGRHREHVTRLADEGEGSIIDWAGDGCFLTFETASAAVAFALRLQQVHNLEADLPGVRVGIHMGEVSLRRIGGSPHVEGLIVDLSSRIAGLATAGQVLISSAVSQSAKQRLGNYEFSQPLRWVNFGAYVLKGYGESVEICEVGPESLSPFEQPKANEKAWPKAENRSSKFSSAVEPEKVIRKIAVLPFKDMGAAADEDWFAEGMTETLVAQLAKIGGMRVISRTSAMRYKGTNEPIPIVAQALGADALVEGSVQRAGDQVRITAQLIHGETDEHVWADSYDGKLDNILSLQSKVALDIAKEIQIAVSPEESRRMLEQRAVNPEAHEAVLQGRFHWNKRTRKGFELAVQRFQCAVELDPLYAPAHAGLADTYTLQASFGHARTQEIVPLAKMAAERAVELDPASTQGFAALARNVSNFDWDWDKAEELFQRAIELDPDYPTAHHWYRSFLHSVAGRLDESLAEASLACKLDPLSAIISTGLSEVHEYRRDYAKAIAQLENTLDMHPNFKLALMLIVRCYVSARDYESARPYQERLRATGVGSTFALIADSKFFAAAGEKERATQFAAKALQQIPTLDFYSKTYLATAFWEVDNYKKAFALLSEAVDERASAAIHLLPAHPWFDPMRGDSHFQALLDQMKLPPLPPDHPVTLLDRPRAVG